MKAIFENSPTSKKVVILIAAIVVFFYILLGLSLFFVKMFFGIGLSEMMNGGLSAEAENLPALRFLQVVQSIALFVVPALVVAYLFSNKPLHYLQLHSKANIQLLFLTAGTIIFLLPFINLLAFLNSKLSLPDFLSGLETAIRSMEDSAMEMTDLFLNVKTTGLLFFNIFMIAVLPAVGEELLFRGVLQRIITEATNKPHLSIFLTAAIFSAFHLQFFGFLPRLLLGMLFGYLLLWSKSLLMPMLAHFLNNAIAIISYYFISAKGASTDLETYGGTSETILPALFTGVIGFALLYLFYRTSKNVIQN